MLIQKFCGAHYRRRVPYVPMLVPTMSIEQMGCIIHYREDLIYELKCPVCWDNAHKLIQQIKADMADKQQLQKLGEHNENKT